jgi:regulator of sigma E protease
MFNFFADPSNFIVNIVLLLIVLVVLVVIHELGHFVVARRAGVTVHEFGIGFPPRAKVMHTDSKGTAYTLNWLPIGGFVKLEGEDGGESDDPNAFSRRPLSTRLAILLAGVFMNILLAFVIFSGIAMFADPVVHARIDVVQPDTPAESIGLRGGTQIGTDGEGNPIYDESGDVIIAIDGRQFPVFDNIESTTLPSLAYLRNHAGQEVTLTIRSADGTVRDVPVTLRVPENDQQGALGIIVHPTPVQDQISHGPLEAVIIGAQRTWQAATLVLRGLGELITNIGNPPVSGPVGIVDTIGQVRAIGAPIFLVYLIGLLSANLAVVNALPFPPLDGGRVAVALIQRVSGNRVSEAAERLVYLTGFILLMLLLVYVTFFDIQRLG